MSYQIPTISLSAARSSQHIIDEIRTACLTYGFFQVKDYVHIVPQHLPSRALEASRQFFHLPLATKERLAKVDIISGGYEYYKAMNLDPADEGGYGHNEGFSFAAAPNPTAWPPEAMVPGFKETMIEYYSAVSYLAQHLCCYIATGLGLPEYFFDDFFQDQLAHVKLAHYYRPHDADADRSNIGVAPHTDWGAITVLLQDDVGGLEVLDRGTSQWIQVPPTPDAFVINIGDLLQRWTNDSFKSTKHRVTSPPADRHRYSIPFFSQGRPDYVIEVIPCCIQAGTEAKYPPIKAEEYLRLKFESTYSMKG